MGLIIQDCSHFNNKILFQRLSSVQNEKGEWQDVWNKLYCSYGQANNLYGSEYYAAVGSKQEKTTVFTLRYSPALKNLQEKDRIIFKDEIYDIVFIDNLMNSNSILKIKAMKRAKQIRTNVEINVISNVQLNDITVKYDLNKWNYFLINNKVNIDLIPGRYTVTVDSKEYSLLVTDKDMKVNYNVQ